MVNRSRIFIVSAVVAATWLTAGCGFSHAPQAQSQHRAMARADTGKPIMVNTPNGHLPYPPSALAQASPKVLAQIACNDAKALHQTLPAGCGETGPASYQSGLPGGRSLLLP